jgi:taurine dioxygenase
VTLLAPALAPGLFVLPVSNSVGPSLAALRLVLRRCQGVLSPGDPSRGRRAQCHRLRRSSGAARDAGIAALCAHPARLCQGFPYPGSRPLASRVESNYIVVEARSPQRHAQGTPMHDVIDITVTPLSRACGAEISGIDLTRELSDASVRAIRRAWEEHLVLVFRGQAISQEQQLRFASYFGELGDRKQAPAPLRGRAEGIYQDHRKVLLVSNIKVDGQPIGAFGEGEFWFHIDSGYTPRPYKYTFLYALELPSIGGNTRFSNMYKAYEAVPPDLKARLKGKKALHIHEYKRSEKADLADISGIPHCYHPVFITHPDTGRRTLFVDRLMTARIDGLAAGESEAILDELYEIGERPDFIFEHVWKLGDFLMWDNRCTIHARTDFPKDERRLLRRCTVEGGPLNE